MPLMTMLLYCCKRDIPRTIVRHRRLDCVDATELPTWLWTWVILRSQALGVTLARRAAPRKHSTTIFSASYPRYRLLTILDAHSHESPLSLVPNG
jgi:hypothetical protein